MVSSLGFDNNVLGSHANCNYLSFSSILVNCYFLKHKIYNFARLNQIIHSADLSENLRYTLWYFTFYNFVQYRLAL